MVAGYGTAFAQYKRDIRRDRPITPGPRKDIHTMATEHPRPAVGMEVTATDGKHVGEVKEIGEQGFLVNRRFRRDLHLPFSTIERVVDNQVILKVTEFELDYLSSVSPPITGGPGATYEEE